jgi:MYXO-CTERM domain-containing protein
MPSVSWAARFTALQLAVSSAALMAFFGAAWLAAAGDLVGMMDYCWIAYLIVTGLWVTRRVASAVALALESARQGAGGSAGVFERTMLPLYCAVALLTVAVVLDTVSAASNDAAPQDWFVPARFAGHGVLAVLASAIATLCIWRRQGQAGWIAVTVAQLVGAATAAASFYLSLSVLIPVDGFDRWYSWTASPPILWLLAQMIAIALGLLAVARLWQATQGDGLAPWATLLGLMVAIGYLAGFAMLTGIWLSSWLYGAFFMARLATYAFFLCEPKDQPIARSSWFVCYLVTLALCVATTAHQVATGNFAMMMQPVLMEPLAAAAAEGAFWSFSLSLTLTLTRDILFLLWLNRARPQGWADAIGVAVLVLLYGPVAIGIALLGLGFLLPVLYPLSVTGPVDLIWPLAMIAVLAALLLRRRRDGWATT